MDGGDSVYDDGRPPWYLFVPDRARLRDRKLDLAAQVVCSGGVHTTGLQPQQRAITDLCRQWLSVAEVAHYLDAPLAVARVLVEDLVDRSVLRVSEQTFTERPNIAVLRLVRDRLQML